MDRSEPRIRRARPDDTTAIIQLYQEGYAGQYPDPLMASYALCHEALGSDAYLWMVAESGGRLVGSVVYRIDATNRLSKAFGALVLSELRGHKLTEKLMVQSQGALTKAIDVVYATTRTVALAPQKLTANLGYRKLGIFPNVHKTDEYETHCLTALFSRDALARRFTKLKLHPKIARLYEIVSGECGLPPLPVAKGPIDLKVRASDVPASEIELETIVAPKFVGHRFRAEVSRERSWFYPFLEPNLLLTTADQGVEVFTAYSEADKHCVLIGIRDTGRRGYSNIFESACRTLRGLGARYIEFIIRADELRKIETALRAQFLPCAYFPALELGEGGVRYDYVIFSRSFEILDFRNVRLEGVNHDYLMQYFDSWKEISLAPVLLQR